MLLFRLHAWWGIESWGTECTSDIVMPESYPFGMYPKGIRKHMPAGVWNSYYQYLNVVAKNWWRMKYIIERYDWVCKELETLDRLWPQCEIKSEFVVPYKGFLIIRPKVVVGHGPWVERFERPKYLMVYEEMFWEARERKGKGKPIGLFVMGKYLGSSRYMVRRPPASTTAPWDDWFHLHVKYWHYPEDGRCRVRVLWRSAAEFVGPLTRVGVYTYRLGREKEEAEKVLKRPPR